MNAKIIAEEIFLAGVESVMPDKMIRQAVYLQDTTLFISDIRILLDTINNIYIIGAGKASAIMAKEMESILSHRITEGLVVVKYGHGFELKHTTVLEAGHPVPDNNGYTATQKILEIATKANNNDLIICLISGGGSALLTDFPEGGSVEDIVLTNSLLLKSGADIKEINTVRKHLSKVKGGQLAKASHPATLISLVLSDVIGNPPDVIASGPTVPDTSTFKDAINVIEKYNLVTKIPKPIFHYLKEGVKGVHEETPKPSDPAFINTHNIIIGSNIIALDAAYKKSVSLGLNTFLITTGFEGDTIETADQMVETALQFQNDTSINKPCCLLFGGETTLHVTGNGKGGRNQHMALYAASLLRNKNGITFLAAGTDGNDGPTKAAGAVVDSKTMESASMQDLDAFNYLIDFDSFHFFEKTGGHIITGPTMTNVMDIVIIIIE
jgi:glycerate 2-kinase